MYVCLHSCARVYGWLVASACVPTNCAKDAAKDAAQDAAEDAAKDAAEDPAKEAAMGVGAGLVGPDVGLGAVRAVVDVSVVTSMVPDFIVSLVVDTLSLVIISDKHSAYCFQIGIPQNFALSSYVLRTLRCTCVVCHRVVHVYVCGVPSRVWCAIACVVCHRMIVWCAIA